MIRKTLSVRLVLNGEGSFRKGDWYGEDTVPGKWELSKPKFE